MNRRNRKHRPRTGEVTVTQNVSMPERQRRNLAKVAEDRGVSISLVVCELLDAYFPDKSKAPVA